MEWKNLANRVFQLFNQRAYCFGLATCVAFNLFDDTAADNNGIRYRTNLTRTLRIIDAEADTNRNIDVFAQKLYLRETSSVSKLAAPVTPLSDT